MGTENEMEYVVSCTKHIFEKHVVLQFTIVNTIDDQKLQNIFVNIEVDGDAYVVEKTIPASFASYGETSTSYVSLSKVGDPVPCSMSCELRFKVIQVDPTNGDVEGDEDGYEEEYPLETIEISTSDFMAKTSTGDFRRCWEGAGNEMECWRNLHCNTRSCSKHPMRSLSFWECKLLMALRSFQLPMKEKILILFIYQEHLLGMYQC